MLRDVYIIYVYGPNILPPFLNIWHLIWTTYLVKFELDWLL
jgi:hypothetical protein